MGHTSSETSRKEVNVPEVQSATDNPQTSAKGLDNVLLHRKDFREPTPKFSEIESAYSSAWADLKAAMNVLKRSAEDHKEANYSWIAGHIDKSKRPSDVYDDARKRFRQTPPGKIRIAMRMATQQARERLAQRGQQEGLGAATAARKKAEAALHAVISSKAEGSNLETEARKNLQSAWDRERAVAQELGAISEWKQWTEIESVESEARKAWEDLQKQVMLYYLQGQEAIRSEADEAVPLATFTAKKVEEATIPEIEFMNLTEKSIKELKKAKDIRDAVHEYEQFFRQALGIPQGAIPEPNASAFHEAKKAWRQSTKEFQAFREQSNQEE